MLFVVVTLNSPPTLPSIPGPQPDSPSPKEVYILEEVAEWVLGHPISDHFRAFSDSDIVDAVQQRQQSFELFRSFSEEGARKALLGRLPYGELIGENAERYRIDGLLLASIMQAESGFNAHAISPMGALGLMQVMPKTAGFHSVEDLLEPAINIDVGTRYFVSLLDRFDGNVALALAGYNAGPESINRFGGMPPYRETRAYVDRVLTQYVQLQRSLWQNSGESDWLFGL